MYEVKLSKVGNSLKLTLPVPVVEMLHLQAGDAIAVEVMGDLIVLTHSAHDFHDAWAAYQALEQRHRNADKKLAE